MKKLLTFLGAVSLLCSTACSDDNDDHYAVYSYDDPTIYSSSDKILLTEAILFVSPYVNVDGEKKYIVADNVANLVLKVNKRSWKPTNSYPMDTLNISGKKTEGLFRVVDQKIQYPFAVNVRVAAEGLTTAGEYADLLNNYLSLQPGSYICQIESFEVKMADGVFKKVYTPTLVFPLEVKENQASVNLGVFDIMVE